MIGHRASARRVAELRDELSGCEFAVLRQLRELRYMSGGQITRVHFPDIDHASVDAAHRAARRTLERLHEEGLAVRLQRRVGGIRAGSSAFVYALGAAGSRVLDRDGSRLRHHEPSPYFLKHTLAISEFVVKLTEASRSGGLEIVSLQSEPACHRPVSTAGGTTSLKPDVFATVAVGDIELDWFVEVDLGSEHLPTLLKKCVLYEAHYRSGVEQARHGVAPRTLWLMHTGERADRLRRAIDNDPKLTSELFMLSIFDRAIEVVTGGTS